MDGGRGFICHVHLNALLQPGLGEDDLVQVLLQLKVRHALIIASLLILASLVILFLLSLASIV